MAGCIRREWASRSRHDPTPESDPITMRFFRKRSVEGVWFDESLGAGTIWRSGEAANLLLQLLQRKAVLLYDPAWS
jgi:hypothetical protein